MSKRSTILKRLFRCAVQVLRRGRARAVPKKPEHIAIFQFAQLGDMVCTTPVFRAIRKQYPDVRLSVVGLPRHAELLAHNSDVNKYIPYTTFEKTRDTLAEDPIDFAISVVPSFTALSLAYLSGARAIVTPTITNGFSPNATLAYRFLCKLAITKPHRIGSYAPREYLRLLEPIGIHAEDTAKHLGYSREASEKIDQFFLDETITPDDLIVGISPSSGNKIKNWGAHRFAKVAEYIYSKYDARIIIIGGQADIDEIAAFRKSISPTVPIIDVTHAPSLDMLKALIARMHVFIAVDTGPIYIAEAFGVKTVDIVGPVDDREQPPTGQGHAIVVSPTRGEPAIHIMNARIYDYAEARRQIDTISVDSVCAAFDSLMAQKS